MKTLIIVESERIQKKNLLEEIGEGLWYGEIGNIHCRFTTLAAHDGQAYTYDMQSPIT